MLWFGQERIAAFQFGHLELVLAAGHILHSSVGVYMQPLGPDHKRTRCVVDGLQHNRDCREIRRPNGAFAAAFGGAFPSLPKRSARDPIDRSVHDRQIGISRWLGSQVLALQCHALLYTHTRYITAEFSGAINPMHHCILAQPGLSVQQLCNVRSEHGQFYVNFWV